MADHEFRKSSFCGAGACVEVNMGRDGVVVRNSRKPRTELLVFTHEEWMAFVAGVRQGEFDFEEFHDG